MSLIYEPYLKLVLITLVLFIVIFPIHLFVRRQKRKKDLIQRELEKDFDVFCTLDERIMDYVTPKINEINEYRDSLKLDDEVYDLMSNSDTDLTDEQRDKFNHDKPIRDKFNKVISRLTEKLRGPFDNALYEFNKKRGSNLSLSPNRPDFIYSWIIKYSDNEIGKPPTE